MDRIAPRSAEKLETMLNKKPGQFFPVDADGDGAHDYIGVAEEAKAKRGAHALVLAEGAGAADLDLEAPGQQADGQREMVEAAATEPIPILGTGAEIPLGRSCRIRWTGAGILARAAENPAELGSIPGELRKIVESIQGA